MTSQGEMGEALRKIRQFGTARNRSTDTETRHVIITDDEALALVEYIDLITDALNE
jgi:hypothetical protein